MNTVDQDQNQAPKDATDIESLHQSVMVDEVLSGLGITSPTGPNETHEDQVPAALDLKKKTYVDCTLGLGGHTEAILRATPENSEVIGIDRDSQALALAEERLHSFSHRLTLRKGTFKDISTILDELNRPEVDGILFDFGVSSLQLDDPARGFSFQSAGPLDMRMDQAQGESAATLVNRLSERELMKILRLFGDERRAPRIAANIIQYRQEKGLITRTEELEDIVWKSTPARFRHGRIHPATRTFQALRMAVNDELSQVEMGLETAVSQLKPFGRLVTLSFHSLEDRCAKHLFKHLAHRQNPSEKKFRNLYKKPLTASPEEINHNRRSRSAKLRVLERAA